MRTVWNFTLEPTVRIQIIREYLHRVQREKLTFAQIVAVIMGPF